ncbi:MAG: BrnT family toxin [Pseudomonadota bacterium]
MLFDIGFSFEEAHSVFYDENAIQYYDIEHAEDEDRFLLLGLNFSSETLVVCHCVREEDMIVRLISARKADKKEQQVYWSKRT